VFDNIGYGGKPDLTREGSEPMNIVYEGWIWPGKTKGTSGRKSPSYGVVPDETFFKTVLSARCKRPGPIVLDIEFLSLTGDPQVAQGNEELLATLVRWTHEAMPGRLVCFYGLLPNRKPGAPSDAELRLSREVDAYFPSMYTFDDNRSAWQARCASYVKRAHELSPTKPVYVYLWPQYHENTRNDEQFIDADYWTFELETGRASGADGSVIWSSNRNIKTQAPLDWGPDAQWLTILQAFLRRISG
jgi:hypothetical protein